ncbi:MAG: hypothetical protein GX028_12795 [Clostridiaceae bacterium]|nr:hypothetical protein [Clostridiaceae bacterium]
MFTISWICSLQNKVQNSKLAQSLRSRNGFGTLEVVIIIAVLLTVALIFRKTLSDYAGRLIDAVFDQSIIDNMGDYTLS